MSDKIFEKRPSIEANAYFLGRRLTLKNFKEEERLTQSPFVIKAGMDGYAVLFRYGTVVLFGLNAVEEEVFLKDLEPFVVNSFDSPSHEVETVVVDKSKQEGSNPKNITLKQWDLARLQLVADVLSKSAVLSYFENNMSETFDKLEPIAAELQSGGPAVSKARDLIRHVGMTLSTQRMMVGHVEIDDKPELLWEHVALEGFYSRLEDDFEIQERYEALQKKLDLIYRTSDTLLHMLHERKSLRVEWYIVILIIFDILLHLAEKYLGI